MSAKAAAGARPHAVAPADRVPLATKFYYALPGMPLQAMGFAALAILPTYYATHTQVTLTEIGVVLLATRIFDAVVHPLVGYVSDLTLGRVGRKSWVVAGACLTALAAFFLFTPPETAGATYFTFWSVMLYAAWTVLEVPHRAWGSELSRDYHERSRIFAVLGQVRLVGAILFLGVPLLPAFASSDITQPAVLFYAGVGVAIVFPLTALIAALLVPEGRRVATEPSTLIGLLRSVAGNKPFWIFLAVFALSGIGIGLYNSVLLLFVRDYLKIGPEYPYLAVLYFAVSLPMVGVWGWAMNRMGKHRAWALGLGAFALLLPVYWIVPAGPDAVPYAIVLTVLIAITSSAQFVAPLALLGDIVDFDILKTRVNRSGNYFALLQLAQTAEIAIGGGIGFLLLGWFGYTPKAENGPEAIFGLKLTFLLLPAILYLLSAFLVLFLPITAKRHATIRKALRRRAEREKTESAS